MEVGKIEGGRYTNYSYHSKSLSNKMLGDSLAIVKDINHKYIVVRKSGK